MSKTTGARLFAEMIRAYGITHLFYVPQIISRALAALDDSPVKRIVAHSEKAAAYMADGYARARGGPGICMAQPVGASNLASGLRDAALAGSPVIAISGGPAAATRNRNAYQEIDDLTQFDAVTKLNTTVDHVSRLPDMLRQAFRSATSGAPGPVHLRFPGRHGEGPLAECDEQDARAEPQFAHVPPFRPCAEATHLQAAAALLMAAERPVIIAGGGVQVSGAQAALLALAERWQIPVATSPNGKGVILDAHPLAFGVVGTYSRSSSNRAVAEADLVFFVGSPAGGLVTANWRIPGPGARVIQLDIDAEHLGRNYPNAASLHGDARMTLQALLAVTPAPASPSPARAAWLAQVRTWSDAWRAETQPLLDSSAVPLRPERLCSEITRALPPNGVVVADTGHAAMWTSTLVELTHRDQRYIRCAGSLGWALPGAIGVKCALPERPVLCFTGDGGMHYHLSELETAARHKINLVVVVNNNSALNQEINSVETIYGGQGKGRSDELWRFGDVDFAKVAEAMGCKGIRVTQPEQLAPALQLAFSLHQPVVIDVVTDVRAFARKAWVPA